MSDRDHDGFGENPDDANGATTPGADSHASDAGAAAPGAADGDTAEGAARAAPSGADEAPLTVEDILAEAGEAAPEEPALAPEDEHLADLRRVSAEYANYRKRAEREKEALREISIAEVVRGLLPVLDDLDRAKAHGDLEDGPMAVIAGKLRASIERYGLEPFGAKGEPFDPQIHEALVQLPTPGATGQTIADVVETGYRLGERVIRVAKVAVAVPAE